MNQRVAVNMEEYNERNSPSVSAARKDTSEYKYTKCCHNIQFSSDLLPKTPKLIKVA